MKKSTKIVLAIAAVLIIATVCYFLFFRKSVSQMKSELLSWINSDGGDSEASKKSASDAINRMSDPEISDTYAFVFNYMRPGKTLPDGDLKNRITAIGTKYNLFT